MKLNKLMAMAEHTPLRQSLDFLFQYIGEPMYFETPAGFLEILSDTTGVLTATFIDILPKDAHMIKSVNPLNINMSTGTDIQQIIWRAVCKIPRGETRSYGTIAKSIGDARIIARTVGSAMASNPIAYLIPCHRVIKADGKIGGYHWGETRKKILLEWEKMDAI